jgi:hypothetical protein
MDTNQIKKTTTYALVGFALLTIGFALGKEVTLRRLQSVEMATPNAALTGDKVLVYYAHASVRCVTCETIERLTQETLNQRFADPIASGRMVFKQVNFQTDQAFARQYEISANCVVVVDIQDGKETDYNRLEGVWDHFKDPPVFKDYIAKAINAYLLSEKQEATL